MCVYCIRGFLSLHEVIKNNMFDFYEHAVDAPLEVLYYIMPALHSQCAHTHSLHLFLSYFVGFFHSFIWRHKKAHPRTAHNERHTRKDTIHQLPLNNIIRLRPQRRRRRRWTYTQRWQCGGCAAAETACLAPLFTAEIKMKMAFCNRQNWTVGYVATRYVYCVVRMCIASYVLRNTNDPRGSAGESHWK